MCFHHTSQRLVNFDLNQLMARQRRHQHMAHRISQPMLSNRYSQLEPMGSGSLSAVGLSLGEDVDVDGPFLVSGSRGDVAQPGGGGSVHVFDRASGALMRKLFPSDPSFATNFGDSVATSDGLVLIGASFDDTTARDAGSAYVFDGATGQQLHKLVPTDIGEDDLFGRFVAIEGNTAVVGAPFLNSATGIVNVGAVYVFAATTGAQIARRGSPDPGIGHRFGDGLAISDDHLLVGESLGWNTAGVRAGAIWVYDRHTLALLHRLEASDGQLEDALGEGSSIARPPVVVGEELQGRVLGVDLLAPGKVLG